MAIFEPANQTTYNTPVDQRTIQQTSPYNSIKPSVYLTRTIHRLAAATHGSPNTILSGMDVTYVNGIGLNIMTFSVAPGSVMVDSVIVDTHTSTMISTGVIPITSPSKLKVGIFAAYNFSATSNVQLSLTSYIFDMQDNLIEPTIFGGNEKVLLSVFEIDLSGSNIVASNRINDWVEVGNAATLSNTSSQLHVSNAQAYPGYGYIDTSIPSNKSCDFTVDVISGNASVHVGNTIPNSVELLNLSSAVPATLTGSFVTTSNKQTIALGSNSSVANDISVFDNVQIEYPSDTNLLVGDNSTFASSIGNWNPSQSDSAVWNGVDSISILSGADASYALNVGVDIAANSTLYIRLSTYTNLSISVGISGALSGELLIKTPVAVSQTVTVPNSGIVTITLSTSTPSAATASQIIIADSSKSLVVGDSSLFLGSTGNWQPTSATALFRMSAAPASIGSMVVTNLLNQINVGYATLSINVIAGVQYSLIFDVLTGLGYSSITGAVAAPIITNSIAPATSISTIFTASATGVVTIGLGAIPWVGSPVESSYDNVTVVPYNVLTGGSSTFASSIGNWRPSVLAATVSAGILNLTNVIATAIGSEADISQSITLQQSSRYQFEVLGLIGGTFQILDGAIIVASSSADGIVKFTTLLATSYILKFSNNSTIINGTASLDNINIYPRLNALLAADASFTSIANWKTTTFDNVYYAGDGLRLVNQLTFGAQISRTITGFTIGNNYRLQITGSVNAQILVGPVNGNTLPFTGVTDIIFAPSSTSVVVTLRVNSTVVNAEATFLAIDIRRDNTHNAQSIVSANGIGSKDIKQLTTNNPSNRLSGSISVGSVEYITAGGSSRKDAIEGAALSIFDHSVGTWVTDIPRFKPTRYNLPYIITSVLF